MKCLLIEFGIRSRLFQNDPIDLAKLLSNRGCRHTEHDIDFGISGQLLKHPWQWLGPCVHHAPASINILLPRLTLPSARLVFQGGAGVRLKCSKMFQVPRSCLELILHERTCTAYSLHVGNVPDCSKTQKMVPRSRTNKFSSASRLSQNVPSFQQIFRINILQANTSCLFAEFPNCSKLFQHAPMP